MLSLTIFFLEYLLGYPHIFFQILNQNINRTLISKFESFLDRKIFPLYLALHRGPTSLRNVQLSVVLLYVLRVENTNLHWVGTILLMVAGQLSGFVLASELESVGSIQGPSTFEFFE